MENMEKCCECGKKIPDAECVDNWGFCDICFNKYLDFKLYQIYG